MGGALAYVPRYARNAFRPRFGPLVRISLPDDRERCWTEADGTGRPRASGVTLRLMDTPQQRRPGRSFSNGNGPATIILPLEGHVINAVHWWWNG